MKISTHHPPRACSPNGRAHWAQKAACVKEARTLARLLTLEAMGKGQGLASPPSRYRVTWFYKGARPDDDNVLSRCKAIKDGACDALRIDDRTLRCKSIDIIHDKARAGWVDFEVF